MLINYRIDEGQCPLLYHGAEYPENKTKRDISVNLLVNVAVLHPLSIILLAIWY